MDMKDIKSLYFTAKDSGKKDDIASYVEEVNRLHDNDPTSYAANLEYIISTTHGASTLKSFIEKWGIPLHLVPEIHSTLESCNHKMELRGIKNLNVYPDVISYIESIMSKYPHCVMMTESFPMDKSTRNDYIAAYYQTFETPDGTVRASTIPHLMINKFHESAIPDLMITANNIGGQAPKILLEYMDREAINDPVSYQHVYECCQDINQDGIADIISHYSENGLDNIVHGILEQKQGAYRESVLNGDENPYIEYTEDEINAIKSLIAYKESKLTMASEDQVIGIYNEIMSLYPELDGLIDESGEIITESIFGATANQKKGKIPGYLANNHDMGYGEDDSDSNDQSKRDTDDLEKRLEEYRRKSAQRSSSIIDDDDDEDDPDVTVTSPTARKVNDATPVQNADRPTSSPPVSSAPSPVNNYYYYSYMNSNNRNTNSYNRRSSYDRSTGKHIRSHNNGSDDDDMIDEHADELTDDQIVDLFCESIIAGYIESYKVITESADQKFRYAYKAAWNYDNGHAIKVTYSLDHITVTNIGNLKPFRDEVLSIVNDYASTITDGRKFSGIRGAAHVIRKVFSLNKNIESRKKVITDVLNQYIQNIGYFDFQAKDCEIVEIYDRADRVTIDGPINIVGVYAAADFNKSKSLRLSDYAMDRMQSRVNRPHSTFKVSKIKVGDIQTTPTFMTTHWDDHADRGLIDPNGRLISDDDADRDNSSLLQTAREIHGFDMGAGSNVSLTDALSDFITPTMTIAFGQGKDRMAETELTMAKQAINNLTLLSTQLHSSINMISDPNDTNVISDMASKVDHNIIDAKTAIQSKDWERVYDLTSIYDDIADKFISFCNDHVNDYPSLYDLALTISAQRQSSVNKDGTMLEYTDAELSKPQSDHPIRDTLQDIDRGLGKVQQGAKKKVTDLQITARAVAKPFKRGASWIGKIIDDWKDKNENEIKEKMVDPRSRNKLMDAIKKAIIGGSLFKAGLLLNPVFLFLGIASNFQSKDKKYRIRNEIISELKIELEILDDKIKKADYDGDTKNKYKLMRFKNELEKKLLRVGGGKQFQKYI